MQGERISIPMYRNERDHWGQLVGLWWAWPTAPCWINPARRPWALARGRPRYSMHVATRKPVSYACAG